MASFLAMIKLALPRDGPELSLDHPNHFPPQKNFGESADNIFVGNTFLTFLLSSKKAVTLILAPLMASSRDGTNPNGHPFVKFDHHLNSILFSL